MTHPPHPRRQRRAGSGRPAVYDIAPDRRPAIVRLFVQLRSLARRGEAAIGEVYAVAAGSFLTRVEQLEDRRAERRFRQHSDAARNAAATSLPRRTSEPS